MKKAFHIIAISFLFVACLSVLFHRQKDRLLAKNENRLCLTDNLSKTEFCNILLQNAYADTPEDAKLISEWLIDSLFVKKEMILSNLGSLNSRDFQIPASEIENRGGEGLKNRLSLSYKDLGCDSISLNEYKECPANLPSSDSTCIIKISVDSIKEGKFHLSSRVRLEGVCVRLKQHKIVKDSLSQRPIEEDVVVAYAKTNSNGEVSFNVLKGGYYSVLPIKKGFEFGLPKGTTHNKPIGDEKVKTFSFTQKEHRLRMFDKTTYARIKADDLFIVRSTSDYVTELVKIATLFLLAWWCTFFFVQWKDKKLTQLDPNKFQASDHSIISLLMLLNAICLFMMLAITNPLVDRNYANEMIWGTIFGCIGLCLFSSFDYVKYYTGQYVVSFGKVSKWLKKLSWMKQHNLSDKVPERIIIKFDFVSKWLKERFSTKVPEGIGFLLLALGFVVLLGLFGTGPEGSTAKVNLNIGFLFQPSEISKFLFVIAIALFFTANASKINAFADGKNPKGQFQTLVWVVFSVLILLSLYVGLISDMGPALVLAVTFIIIYSIVRHDLLQMFIGVVSYLVVLYIVDYLIQIDSIHALSSNKLAIVLYLSLIWFILWFSGGYFWKKKIYESAGFMNLLILLFAHGGELLNMCGFTNQGQRLMDRIATSGDGIWDNSVKGGDQVAQGIWALSSGGFWGQGIGNGNANLVPAFHTDMIFESIGEVMGFVTLFLILVCYALLIRKCLIRAKESGHPFMFYLIAGIAIVTVVQLFVIVMGSLGIVPLTGVSLPFLSYGKAGLVINLAAFGIILGMSRNRPTLQQKISIIGYNNVIKSGIVVFTFFFVVVVAYAFNYQVLSRDTYLTKPAYITNLAGEHFPEQNPRINILLRNIHSGNIYDRNGLLLATSNPNTLLLYKEPLSKVGIKKELVDSLSNTSKKRYYPFGEHLFFMLGDMNTRNLSNSVFSKNPYGYLAEERLIDSLRGLSIPTQNAYITRVLKVSPYLPDSIFKDDWKVPLYGKNQSIVDMLKDGVNGTLVKQWNEKRTSRDVTLTVDANLQMRIQNALSCNANKLSDKYSRISLVILKADSGDLLCSANYPLPNQEQIVSLFEKRQFAYRPDTLYGRYTERDLALTFQSAPGSTAKIFSSAAGLNKNGQMATRPIPIYKEERIHTTGSLPEPYGDHVDMKRAIVESSNCYFVNLVHRDRLYDYLDTLYMNTGVGVGENVSYIFDRSELSDSGKDAYFHEIENVSLRAYRKYDDYIDKRGKGKGQKGYRKMNFPDCAMAWGQGVMSASPLNMARMASIIANDGLLTSTRYLIGAPIDTIRYMKTTNASLLKSFMHEEALSHGATKRYAQNECIHMGGKTGTPTRNIAYAQAFGKGKKTKAPTKTNSNVVARNDGWYVCFLNSKKGPLALALRIELCSGSSQATKWINEVLMPTLQETGYVEF